MNFLVKNFLRGLVITVPIGVTAYFIYWSFTTIDRFLQLPLPLSVPGLGFLLTIVLIILIGFLGSNFIGRKIFSWTERILVRAPIVKIVYFAMKDLTEAFVGERKRFNRPVVVTLPFEGQVKLFGFVTADVLPGVPSEGKLLVFFPQSYNIAGNLLLLPAAWVEPLAVDSSQLMTFIMSGGVSGSGLEPKK
jgi:Uncharacterized conserved protein